MVNTKQHEEGFALESRIAELEAENRGVWREINLLREINALLDDENDDLTLLLDETRKVGIEEVRALESENKLYEDALANYEQRCKGLEAERGRLRGWVKMAYFEGHADAQYDSMSAADDWKGSEARRAIEPTAEVDDD